MGHRVEGWGTESPVEAKSHAWDLVVDVDSVGAAEVNNDSWVPVAVELVVFVEDLLDLFHDARAVVSPQTLDQIVWVGTESAEEELVELDQVTTGAFLQSLFKTSTSVITFTVKASGED